MNTINIGLPTLENVESAMAQIGFTKDTAISTATRTYWKWDTVGKCEIFYDGSNYAFGYRWLGTDTASLYIDDDKNTKACYEELANGGIYIGWSQNSTTPLHMAFVAPSTAGDTWVFIPYSVGEYRICDYDTERIIDYYRATYPYEGIGAISNDVQIISLYNRVRFMQNVYLTCLQPTLGSYDSVRVVIGTKTFLLVRYGGGGASCFAVEIDG